MAKRHRPYKPLETDEQRRRKAEYDRRYRERHPVSPERQEELRIIRAQRRRENAEHYKEVKRLYHAGLVALYQEYTGKETAHGEGAKAREIGMAIKAELKKERNNAQ